MKDFKGRAPHPSSHHQALFISSDRYLCIYGGLTTTTTENKALGDIVLFDTLQCQWESLRQFGFKPDPRWSSCLAYDSPNERLVLFGGRTPSGFCSCQAFTLDLRPAKVQALKDKLLQCQELLATVDKHIIRPFYFKKDFAQDFASGKKKVHYALDRFKDTDHHSLVRAFVGQSEVIDVDF